MLIAVVVVVVIVVAALAGLWAAGVGPFGKKSTNGAAVESFDQAASTGQSAADSALGGSASVAGGTGFAYTTSVSSNSTGNYTFGMRGITGCTSTLLVSASAVLTVPAAGAAPDSGTTASWLIYYSGSGGLVFVAVLSGVVTPLVKFGGSGCPLTMAGVSVGLPGNHVGSTAAFSAADAAGGTAFMANHSGSIDTSFSLSPQISFSAGGHSATEAAMWSITYSNCDLSGSAGTTLDGLPAQQFAVTVNASTGVAGSGSTTGLVCPLLPSPGKTPLASALAIGAVSESQTGADFVYTMTVQTGASSLTWGLVGFHVATARGTLVQTGPINVTTTNPTLNSCNDAVFTFSTGAWSVPTPHCSSGATGGAAAIDAGSQITLSSSVNLNSAGYSLEVVGSGGYPGTVEVSIP